MKDVRVPEQLMRAMAAEAEAAREARAKVIAAEGEHRASRWVLALLVAGSKIYVTPKITVKNQKKFCFSDRS